MEVRLGLLDLVHTRYMSLSSMHAAGTRRKGQDGLMWEVRMTETEHASERNIERGQERSSRKSDTWSDTHTERKRKKAGTCRCSRIAAA